MSAPASARSRNTYREHIHLPSVHMRSKEEDSGFDYEEDLYISGRGRRQRVERVVRLVIVKKGESILESHTFDVLCADELALLGEVMPMLLEEGNPEATEEMQGRANQEFMRQTRIHVGTEQACAGCGCSETRACSGGCVWATTRALCSRCV